MRMSAAAKADIVANYSTLSAQLMQQKTRRVDASL